VLDVGTLRAIGVYRQLDVESLDRVGLEPGDVERVLPRGVQPGFRAAAAVVVLTDGNGVGEQHDAPGGRVGVEDDLGEKVPFVIAVEVDLKRAAGMGLVVRHVVERDIVDLDRPVVARRVRRCRDVRHRRPDGQDRQCRGHRNE
jgi:hypothetical protein